MKLKNTILYIAALSLFSCEMKNEILDGNKIIIMKMLGI